MCYDGACKKVKQVRFADFEGTDPAPVFCYDIGPQESEETCDESSDVAEEVHKPSLVEEFFFQPAMNKTKHGNREKSSRRVRLKIVHGPPLMMTTC